MDSKCSLPFLLEDIQAAKSFIWEHLPQLTQQHLIEISKMTEQERKSHYINKVDVFMKGDVKDGLVTKEIAILTLS